ncbi:phage tail tip fiber protein [Photobacterium kishitanii]|uniref:phage tail tip fiber protein n=1 Tax=Photobacterium kishitanii TaxID=318456 RepID=UPI000D17AFA4|nr:DUF1983 domain-containing protein [Photobacterium kishitanii]PSU23812.1 hypothetical protein CTM84_02585 [Photobacterium kishitanii]
MVSPKNNIKSGFRGGRDSAAIQENIELLTGQRGNGLDRAITMRELASLGLINVTRNSNGAVIPRPKLPVIPDGKPIQRPHSPVSFAALGGFGAIMLEWENPTFYGFSFAELWRAAPNADGSAPYLEQAVLIATTPATVFGDIVNPGSTYYYWCRFVNINNIAGPYNNVDGVKVSTSPNISDIIDDIGEQMKKSDLIQELEKDITEGDNALAGAITALNNVTVERDKVVSNKVDTVLSSLNNVAATVQQNSQSISSLNQDGSIAYKAMWNTKAKAGDIKAGIGLLAKSDGTSQVAISASQFFVFDPNISNKTIQPLFAIDNGKVIIPKAFIEKATIQILNAQTIVADRVKAGISINSPVISGGQVTGGWAGFGSGGPYSGYHTKIGIDGEICTDRLHARGANISGNITATKGRFSNVTIDGTCKVERIEANSIIGDITKILAPSYPNKYIDSQGDIEVFRLNVGRMPFKRSALISGNRFRTSGSSFTYECLVDINGSGPREILPSFSGLSGAALQGMSTVIDIQPNINANIIIYVRKTGAFRKVFFPISPVNIWMIFKN